MKRHEDPAARHEAPHASLGDRRGAETLPAFLLALQRSAGNAAVTALVGRRLQRAVIHGHDTEKEAEFASWANAESTPVEQLRNAERQLAGCTVPHEVTAQAVVLAALARRGVGLTPTLDPTHGQLEPIAELSVRREAYVPLGSPLVRPDPTRLFIGDGPSPDDVHQGSLGTCFLLSALITTATFDPSRIRRAVRLGPGIAVVRLHRWVGEHWRPVEIPVAMSLAVSGGDLKGVRIRCIAGPNPEGPSQAALWVPVLEHAYAIFAERFGIGGDEPAPGGSGLARIDRGRTSLPVIKVLYGPDTDPGPGAITFSSWPGQYPPTDATEEQTILGALQQLVRVGLQGNRIRLLATGSSAEHLLRELQRACAEVRHPRDDEGLLDADDGPSRRQHLEDLQTALAAALNPGNWDRKEDEKHARDMSLSLYRWFSTNRTVDIRAQDTKRWAGRTEAVKRAALERFMQLLYSFALSADRQYMEREIEREGGGIMIGHAYAILDTEIWVNGVRARRPEDIVSLRHVDFLRSRVLLRNPHGQTGPVFPAGPGAIAQTDGRFELRLDQFLSQMWNLEYASVAPTPAPL